MIYLDTHVVVWLYSGRLDALSLRAKASLEQEDLLISPIVLLEMQYLKEIGRIAVPAPDIVQALTRDIGLQVCTLSFPDVVSAALEEDWVRDPFDRLIVGQAKAGNAGLITRDETIRKHFPSAVW